MATKKLLITFLGLFGVIVGYAQKVDVEISSGIYSPSLKNIIERNASALLTEINRAHRAGRSLNFHGIPISADAQKSISMLWNASPFYCEDIEIVESLMNLPGKKYQIRNIPLELTPSKVSYKDDTHQEAVIDFDRNGRIESFYLAIHNNQYKTIMTEGKELEDFDRRQRILSYVEHLRTAYNQKDINFLEQAYSDDALIITGKVIKTKKTDYNFLPKNKVVKFTQSKREYLDNLNYNVFKKNSFISVKFSEIEIYRHPTKPDYYGVSLRQDYDSETYSDQGYLFLLWDFSDESHPVVHVRVWEDLKNFIGNKRFSIHDVKL